jgi:hypothetical protein
MSKNEGLELPPLGPDNIPDLPSNFIYEAIRAEARRVGGRELQEEIVSTALTATSGVLYDRAMSELGDRKPDSIKRIWDRATEMHDNDIARQNRKQRRAERRKAIYREFVSPGPQIDTWAAIGISQWNIPNAIPDITSNHSETPDPQSGES